MKRINHISVVSNNYYYSKKSNRSGTCMDSLTILQIADPDRGTYSCRAPGTLFKKQEEPLRHFFNLTTCPRRRFP